MDTAVEGDCLCKVYRGGRPGVMCFSFEIRAGEVYGLLGPVGAGKTTVLRLIAGLLKPTAGSLRIDGHDCVAERSVTRDKVGALLRPLAGRPPRKLWTRPVLVVDEPALALDEGGRPALGARLRDLAHTEGSAVVLATRRIELARQLCDRVAILKAGRLLDQRPAGLLTDRPGERDWWEIRVKGRLPGGWSEWFAGLSLIPEGDGTLLLTGPLADQAALHGLLARIRDLGLPLLSVALREKVGLPEP